MKLFLHMLMVAALASTVAACGYKGKLKSPAQIEADEQKKARKAAKEEKKTQEQQEPVPAPSPVEEQK